MAKKKMARSTPRGETVAGLRSKVDRLDQDLVRLLNERAALGTRIARLKPEGGEPAYSATREAEIVERAVALSKGPLGERCVRAVFRELLSGSRALERELRVAYLGPAYTYSHIAALERFGESVQYVPVATIPAVFEEVQRGHAEFGLVPLENSTDGRIADTLETFTRIPVKICGEVLLRVHHHLLARCERADVREVYSRPQALSQCRNWLSRHLPQARLIEVTSTATAAQLASEKQGAAAIASLPAGAHYQLQVLAENIEDNQANLTRFAVIGNELPNRSGRDKTAIMFEIEHKPGALADATNVFKKNRLNMTWIESFPIPRPEGGYLFFVELDGYERDAKVRKALDALRRRTVRFELLGSFPRGETIG